MSQSKWRFKIKPDGKVEVEGCNFEGSQCINDIIYKLIKQNATIENEERHSSFGDAKPVENVYYIESH